VRVVTILGTRPEIIRLSRVIPVLDEQCDQVVVHTGQNFEPSLRDVFFAELGLRPPDHALDARGKSPAAMLAAILSGVEPVLEAVRPDRVLILGDTTSALSAIVARQLGIPVFHMEAGNRCYDDRVPEELNRRLVDHASSVLLPYTERSGDNLRREGIAAERIHVTGNPILEVLEHYGDRIDASDALDRLGLARGGFLLATLHRAENVDDPARLGSFLDAFERLHAELGLPIVWSVHPRTRSMLERSGLAMPRGVRAVDPLGLFDFVRLERDARCVLTDSGTVQEECCIGRIPSVTLRDVTERPETLDVGSTVLTGADPAAIVAAVVAATATPPDWTPPPEYLVRTVSATVARLVLGPMP
jgi:UDP-N-acetylglucosamine 2-epimerase (non-hydrolysing)